MECTNCKYLYLELWRDVNVCKITSLIDPVCCNIASDEDVEAMNICYNCKHWLGGGDWGLSCAKNYYNCSINGFDEVCDQFERKFLTK